MSSYCQQNRFKAEMWPLYKISGYSRVPKRLLLDWRLYVACYYPTTPTDYPSTTRDMSVDSSVAVNITFCGYLQFFRHQFCLNYIGTECQWQPFWSTTRVRFTGHCWYFNPQWAPEQTTVKASSVRTVLVRSEKCAFTKCLLIYRCLWRGLGGGRGTFWLLNESLTFNGPEAQRATAVNQIGANKIPPNFDTLSAICV